MTTQTTQGPLGPSVQQVLATDVVPPPTCLTIEARDPSLGLDDIPIDRYFSKQWHDREVEHVWRRTWQMACRMEEIPNVGDHVVYEIVHDSLIVVRTGVDEIRAYVNSCLHRGTQLRVEGGTVERFVCPVHGFTWSLDGTLAKVPAAWDFPHLVPNEFCLPEALVDTWGGFVFVNQDLDAEPLTEYLGVLPEHFEAFRLEDRWKAAHAAKIMPCNWKLAMEAFIESFHIASTHPQTLPYASDYNTQYDVFDGPNINRMVMLEGVASPLLGEFSDDDVIAAMRADLPFYGGTPITVGPGETARQKLAERAREKMTKSTGRDMSAVSDSEALDLIQYLVFPNFSPWAGTAVPLVYRFRPYGDDPERSIMEIMILFAKAPDGSHPEPAKVTWVGIDESWAVAPGMGSSAVVADQDTENLKRIQRGLRASRKGTVTLSQYQESRIRHFHRTLDRALGEPS